MLHLMVLVPGIRMCNTENIHSRVQLSGFNNDEFRL